MPITITLSEGVVPVGKEKDVVAQVTDAFLATHGLAGNKVMTPNVTAHYTVMPKGNSFSGGEEFSGAWVEVKVPSFGLADREVQKKFFAQATEIIHQLSGGKQPKDRIYSNVVHTLDGTWNMDGRAMTNEEIKEAISKG